MSQHKKLKGWCSMSNLVNGKTVKMKLVGLDGNAFVLMVIFNKMQRNKDGQLKKSKQLLMNAKKVITIIFSAH
jgi:hypothetical protein